MTKPILRKLAQALEGTSTQFGCLPEREIEVGAVLKELGRMGYAVVPKEPTGEMIAAGQQQYEARGKDGRWPAIWRAMVSAAPEDT